MEDATTTTTKDEEEEVTVRPQVFHVTKQAWAMRRMDSYEAITEHEEELRFHGFVKSLMESDPMAKVYRTRVGGMLPPRSWLLTEEEESQAASKRSRKPFFGEFRPVLGRKSGMAKRQKDGKVRAPTEDVDFSTPKHRLLPRFFLFRETKGLWRPFFDASDYSYEDVDFRVPSKKKRKRIEEEGACLWPVSFEGRLVEAPLPQVDARDGACEALMFAGGTTLVMGTGCGKTVVGISIWCKLQELLGAPIPLLVVSTYSRVNKQWPRYFKNFAPHAKLGFVGDSQCEFGSNCHAVIASVQTLARPETEARPWTRLFDRTRMVIFDECQQAPTAQSRVVLEQVRPSSFILGLTATPSRSDKTSRAIEWLTGPIAVRVRPPPSPITVWKVRYDAAHCVIRRRGEIEYSRTITKLCNDEERNELILSIASRLVERGRRVLTFQDRRKPSVELCLKAMAKKSGRPSDWKSFIPRLLPSIQAVARKLVNESEDEDDESEGEDDEAVVESSVIDAEDTVPTTSSSDEEIDASASVYLPEVPDQDFAKTVSASMIFSTPQSFGVGVDVDSIDAMISGTPHANEIMVQMIGRILRFNSKSSNPEVVDIVDSGCEVFEALARKRDAIYRERGFKVLWWKD